MGWRPFTRKAAETPTPAAAAPPAPPPAEPNDGAERLTANDWAKKHGLNEVQAERAAMRAGRWHDLFSEEEFLELLRNPKV